MIITELPAAMQPICEKFIDYFRHVPYHGAILLEQFSVPEDTDYGKHKNNDTFDLSNFAAGSFFWPTRDGRGFNLDANKQH
jgi:hypothetical protein